MVPFLPGSDDKIIQMLKFHVPVILPATTPFKPKHSNIQNTAVYKSLKKLNRQVIMAILLLNCGTSNGDDDGVTVHNAAGGAKPLHLRRADGVSSVPVAFQLHDASPDLRCAEYW